MSYNFQLISPKISPNLDKANFQDIFYEEEPYLTNCKITDTVIAHEDIERLIVSNVIFKNVTFIDCTFQKIDLTDVIFENCDLSNTNLSEGIIHRVAFKTVNY